MADGLRNTTSLAIRVWHEGSNETCTYPHGRINTLVEELYRRSSNKKCISCRSGSGSPGKCASSVRGCAHAEVIKDSGIHLDAHVNRISTGQQRSGIGDWR